MKVKARRARTIALRFATCCWIASASVARDKIVLPSSRASRVLNLLGISPAVTGENTSSQNFNERRKLPRYEYPKRAAISWKTAVCRGIRCSFDGSLMKFNERRDQAACKFAGGNQARDFSKPELVTPRL